MTRRELARLALFLKEHPFKTAQNCNFSFCEYPPLIVHSGVDLRVDDEILRYLEHPRPGGSEHPDWGPPVHRRKVRRIEVWVLDHSGKH